MQTVGILASKAPGTSPEPSSTVDIYTVSDYLDLEATSGERYEYFKGKIKLIISQAG